MTGILKYLDGIMYIYILIAVLPGVLSQFDMDVRPDVRFDERNERFDVTALMDPGVYEEREGFRRTGNEMPKKSTYGDVNKTTQKILRMIAQKTDLPKQSVQKDPLVSHLLQLLRQETRRAGSDEETKLDNWAWHDDMKDFDGQQNYEKNLDQFRSPFREGRRNLIDYLHGDQPGAFSSRRNNGDPDKEVLLHHAVPIVMKVKGYLQAPDDVE